MNILLTTRCSLDCSYCFASARRSARAVQEMTRLELDKVLSTLVPGRDPVRLMGGEPTLHSQYPVIIEQLKTQGYEVTVFTNGLQPVLRQTTPHLPDSILLNLNDWSTYSFVQQASISKNLAALAERVSLAYTIHAADFDLSMHRQLIRTKKLHPVIRLGLAQPVFGGDNTYLPDSALPGAHQSVVRWAQALSKDGIRLSLDCGFMRCLFSDADIESLVRAGTVINFDCAPTLDIGPGLNVWRCFAFSAHEGISWADTADESQLLAFFNAQSDFVNEKCINCVHRLNGWCRGGCLARRLKHVEEHARLQDDALLLNQRSVETR